MPLSGESHVISPNSTAVTIECATNSLYVLADANTWEESMSTSVPALLRSTTETEYLAPENTPASAADAWAVRSRSGWAGAGTAALNMLRDADWERTLPDPDLSEKLSSEEPSSATLPSVGSTVAPDRAAPADETLPDEPSPSFEHPRTDNSTTIVTTENIAISTVRRRRTYVSSRVDIIGRRRVRPPTRADTTAGMRHDAAQDTSRPAPRRAHMLCHRAPPRLLTSTPPL